MDKKWALPLGLALVALLILWGSLGMGTASKLFPEKPKAMPPVTASGLLPLRCFRRKRAAASMMRHPISGESRLLTPSIWRR